MPLSGCSSPSDPATDPAQECNEATQPCPYTGQLANLAVLEGARQDGVAGPEKWATVKHATDKVVIEATTEPNTQQVWARLQWSGDAGEAVPGHPNRRRLSRANSRVLRPAVSLAGTNNSVEIWVLGTKIEIKSRGRAPLNAAPFKVMDHPLASVRDLGPKLGTMRLEGFTDSIYPGGKFVKNIDVRGKIVAIATLTPPGVHKVVTSGWTFHRERETQQWNDGYRGDETTTGWDDDTSHPDFLRLTPDANDRIYDTDAPNIRWGESSYEIYHNFRQWVEWHSERCSDYGYWHFRVRWRAHLDQNQQIILDEIGSGQRKLPTNPALR